MRSCHSSLYKAHPALQSGTEVHLATSCLDRTSGTLNSSMAHSFMVSSVAAWLSRHQVVKRVAPKPGVHHGREQGSLHSLHAELLLDRPCSRTRRSFPTSRPFTDSMYWWCLRHWRPAARNGVPSSSQCVEVRPHLNLLVHGGPVLRTTAPKQDIPQEASAHRKTMRFSASRATQRIKTESL